MLAQVVRLTNLVLGVGYGARDSLGLTMNATMDGNTILHFLAKDGRAEQIVEEIKWGSKVNAQNDKGETPMHVACQHDNYGSFIALKQHGADETKRDNAGKVPMDYGDFGVL